MPATKALLLALLARLGLALVFAYHGLLPKILWLSPQEVAMIQAHGITSQIEPLAMLAGVVNL